MDESSSQNDENILNIYKQKATQRETEVLAKILKLIDEK